MLTIKLSESVGAFAENKDTAQKIRVEQIIPAIQKNEKVVLDFEHIDSATQSFVHALISDVIRQYGSDSLDNISFKNCSKTVQKIIEIVVEYMQESN